MNRKEKTTPATKADVEEIAIIAGKEFAHVHTRLDVVDRRISALNEKVDTGFTELRQEMRDGFRVILTAVESVEYTKLRIRIDTLEEDMKHIKAKLRA